MPEIPQEVIDKIDRALTKTITHQIAFANDKPYPDDPRWSPWTRFQKPLAERCREARTALRAALPGTEAPAPASSEEQA